MKRSHMWSLAWPYSKFSCLFIFTCRNWIIVTKAATSMSFAFVCASVVVVVVAISFFKGNTFTGTTSHDLTLFFSVIFCVGDVDGDWISMVDPRIKTISDIRCIFFAQDYRFVAIVIIAHCFQILWFCLKVCFCKQEDITCLVSPHLRSLQLTVPPFRRTVLVSAGLLVSDWGSPEAILKGKQILRRRQEHYIPSRTIAVPWLLGASMVRISRI